MKTVTQSNWHETYAHPVLKMLAMIFHLAIRDKANKLVFHANSNTRQLAVKVTQTDEKEFEMVPPPYPMFASFSSLLHVLQQKAVETGMIGTLTHHVVADNETWTIRFGQLPDQDLVGEAASLFEVSAPEMYRVLK